MTCSPENNIDRKAQTEELNSASLTDSRKTRVAVGRGFHTNSRKVHGYWQHPNTDAAFSLNTSSECGDTTFMLSLIHSFLWVDKAKAYRRL